MSVITVKNLKYRYPSASKLAIDDISFSIEKGEFIGIIGENGAGKSTLSQAINGLVPQFYKGAYGGSVVINIDDGKEIDVSKTPVSANSSYVGLIFQNPFNQLSGAKSTVYDEVAFGLQNLGIDRDEMNNRIETVLRQLDIWQYRDRNPFELSGGQMQRVAIASILVMKPEIIILDEPTSQLDPEGTEEVFRTIDKLSTLGITIIMIEQKLEKLANYCDRIMLMNAGKLIDFDVPDKIFSRDDLEQYGIKPPVYTSLCKAHNITNADGTYPSTIDKAIELLKANNIKLKIEEVLETTPSEGVIEDKLIFKVDNMSFSYQENVKIFDGLNLELTNKPTAIIGQNGAGKTTLVRLLKGLLKPDSGVITLEGDDISSKTVASLASKVGYVFQNPDDQIFKNKVIDEVMFGPINIGMDASIAKENVKKALELTGLTGKEEENPYDLELYERKMVAIASVVAMDTDVIILDEPTIAQDYQGREKIANIIKQLSCEGKLVISILHDMDFVAQNFERVIAMAKGKILLDGTALEVFADEEVLEKARLEKPYILKLLDC